MSSFVPLIAASVAGDIGALIAQVIFAFALLLTAIWGQISQGNRALKMGQDIAFGFFALFVWFIGVAQMISGQVSGLALVIVTILMGTAIFDPVRKVTWARILPIGPDDRMHMLGLVCLLFAIAVFFLTSASVAAPIGTPTDRASVYDPTQARPSSGIAWTAFDPLPAPRKEMGVAAVGNTLYVIGGADASGPVNTVFAYAFGDPSNTGQNQQHPNWTMKAPLPDPRASLAVATLDGKIYAVGGERDGAPLATASVYDPAVDAWTALPPLPEARTNLAAAGANGKLYVLGGTTVAGTAPARGGLATVSVYDPATRQWSAAAPLPTARSGLAAVSVNGGIYALGGQQNGTSLNVAERFDPQRNVWSALPAMPQARRDLAATSRENAIYAAGGIGAAESSSDVQVFDLAANKWTSGPTLVAGGSGLGIAAVNGRLYTLGGAKDQLGQIVPRGGIVFTVGEALVVAALAVVLVGVGVRRTRRLAEAKASRARAGSGRGVIATSATAEESGERFVGGVRFMWRRAPADIRARLGLAAPTPLMLLVAVLGAAALVGVTIGGEQLTARLSPTIAENVGRINAQALANIGGLGAAAVAAVMLALGEELLFRGAIQPRYGVFLTALAFAALHTQYGFPVAPLTVFAIGLVLGVERRYTNTSTSMISHVLFVIAMICLVATGTWTG